MRPKSSSPFYPGQPVPSELFVGRAAEIDLILQRGVGQVSAGKPASIFVEGEFGIGKSSLMGYVHNLAEQGHGLHVIYAPLSGARKLTDVATAIVTGVIRSGAFDPSRSQKIRDWLAKYVGSQKIAGVAVNFEALKQDIPDLSQHASMLDFLRETFDRLKDTGVKGLLLTLDEIGGVAGESFFGEFLKGLVDSNALSKERLPLLLVVCGVEQHLKEMIESYEPVNRLFAPVVPIGPMAKPEVMALVTKTFESVGIKVTEPALEQFELHAGGLPRVLHLIGDQAYWKDDDDEISADDAIGAVLAAADEMGKYVTKQVYQALRSRDYKMILSTLGGMGPGARSFTRRELAKDLNDGQRKKLGNFLTKMQRLNVIRRGDVQGEYVFNIQLVRIFIWLKTFRERQARLADRMTGGSADSPGASAEPVPNEPGDDEEDLEDEELDEEDDESDEDDEDPDGEDDEVDKETQNP